MSRKSILGFLLIGIALVLALTFPVNAQDDAVPMIEVADQVVLDGTVTIAQAYSAGPGFVVIHADSGEGAPGPVVGYRSINAGYSYNFRVDIDPAAATPTLFAMLHEDTGEVGTYEFGTVEGADGPVAVDGAVVTPAFTVNVINANDQFVDNSAVRIASVTVPQRSWVVIHSDADGSPGPVLGQTLVNAGTTASVLVSLSGEATSTLWPMLHVDSGVDGEYEFGTVEGADSPVRVNDRVAVTSFRTVPHMRVPDQIAAHGDAMSMMTTPELVAQSVLSEGPGWLVVHSDADGSPGPVLGWTAVQDGLNTDVAVELDADGVTPTLWPMLHMDTGTVGEYEFGTVEGADGPVVVDGSPLTFPVNAAPALIMDDQALDDGQLDITAALIDAHGWLVIHASQDGGPGPVIAHYPLLEGVNTNISINVDPAAAGAQVFPMLHYDTGEAGVYEFGTVEGADAPVRVAGSVVVAPLNIIGGEAASEMGGDGESADDSVSTSLDGDALVRMRCTVCHSRERINNATKDRAGWEATVDRMIGYGARLNDAERAAVIEYLASN